MKRGANPYIYIENEEKGLKSGMTNSESPEKINPMQINFVPHNLTFPDNDYYQHTLFFQFLFRNRDEIGVRGLKYLVTVCGNLE